VGLSGGGRAPERGGRVGGACAGGSVRVHRFARGDPSSDLPEGLSRLPAGRRVCRGGHVAATLYSLIGTCRLNAIEPDAYLKDVLQRLPSHPINRVAELLPFHWKPATT